MTDETTPERASDHAGRAVRKPARRNLVATVSDRLRTAIREGRLKPGDKLPSEQALTREHAVSRTVIREAIAALRADGLVEPRHGVGVFVLDTQPPTAAFHVETARISSIIEMLELRAAVEAEAAALAAARRSPAQEEAIYECFEDLGRLIAAGEPTTDADLAFHLAIADATNNPRFREVLTMMGRTVIPRSSLQSGQGEATPATYLDQIQTEHRRIVEAISARDDEGARLAMRVHLNGSQERYRSLIRGSELTAAK